MTVLLVEYFAGMVVQLFAIVKLRPWQVLHRFPLWKLGADTLLSLVLWPYLWGRVLWEELW